MFLPAVMVETGARYYRCSGAVLPLAGSFLERSSTSLNTIVTRYRYYRCKLAVLPPQVRLLPHLPGAVLQLVLPLVPVAVLPPGQHGCQER